MLVNSVDKFIDLFSKRKGYQYILKKEAAK